MIQLGSIREKKMTLFSRIRCWDKNHDRIKGIQSTMLPCCKQYIISNVTFVVNSISLVGTCFFFYYCFLNYPWQQLCTIKVYKNLELPFTCFCVRNCQLVICLAQLAVLSTLKKTQISCILCCLLVICMASLAVLSTLKITQISSFLC